MINWFKSVTTSHLIRVRFKSLIKANALSHDCEYFCLEKLINERNKDMMRLSSVVKSSFFREKKVRNIHARTSGRANL